MVKAAEAATAPAQPATPIHQLTPAEEIVQRLALDYWRAWVNDPLCRPIKWHVNETIRVKTAAYVELLQELMPQMNADQRLRFADLLEEPDPYSRD